MYSIIITELLSPLRNYNDQSERAQYHYIIINLELSYSLTVFQHYWNNNFFYNVTFSWVMNEKIRSLDSVESAFTLFQNNHIS